MPEPTFTEAITFLNTGDLVATAAFYENLLGLELVVDQGDCRIYRVSRESFLGFCRRENIPRQPQGVIFTFVSQDVDAWAEKLAANGVYFEKTPALDEKYGIYNCFFRDPNGYLLEIQRFLEPDWAARA
jgi:catechol 2,3-dioxygenase-like lactoylglutathione lyase family enzyme